MEVWLSNHGELVYLPEPGFVIGVYLAVCVIALVYTIGNSR
jgi:hypothetical protein